MPESPVGEWVDIGYAADRTGFDEMTIRRLIDSGDFPAMQVTGASGSRTFCKIPRTLIDEARAAVFAGAVVELRAFARAWSARNAAEGAVA